ncbi:NUDIX hydrolase [Rhodococcus aerolatus]
MTGPVVTAAGAVLWRPASGGGGAVEVAVVHRPRYDDWSLPKGKTEPGEALPVTAVREVEEETGSRAALGRHLGTTHYRVRHRPKTVDYWAARETGGGFAPNDEVDRLEWLSPARARERVTHPLDVVVLDRFTAVPVGGATTTLLLVRHASAGAPGRTAAADRARALDADGRAQAAALVPVTAAFGPAAVHAADRVRCQQTVAPLAAHLRTDVVTEPRLSEEGYARDLAEGRLRAQALLAQPATAVVCSQGGVIPDLVAWWAARDQVPVADLRTRKAATWVVTASAGRVVAIDRRDDPTR